MIKNGKEYLENLTKLMNLHLEINEEVKENELSYTIIGEEGKLLIGHRGETLEAVQYILSQYINKDSEEHIRVTIDADDYRERRKKILTNLARKLARDAYNNSKKIELEPMNSYERRIIHSALQDNHYATTNSEGEGKFRHIVIIPNCEIKNVSYGTSNGFKKKGYGKTKTYGAPKRKF